MSIKRSEELFIVDVDVHIHNSPKMIAPYCEMPWRRSLEEAAENDTGFYSLPGYSPTLVLDPQFPADNLSERTIQSPSSMREQLDALGIESFVRKDYLYSQWRVLTRRLGYV